MVKSSFLLMGVVFLLTLFSFSAYSIAEQVCCCEYDCDSEICDWIDSCPRNYELCDTSWCSCDSDDDCPSHLSYCNLVTNECQEEDPICERSEYDSYDKAAEDQIACGGILSGCLWKTDDKYYKVEETAGKEVNVTVKHSGEGCEKNDLYIYGRNQYIEIGRSTGRYETDSWDEEPETDFIVVRIAGDDYQRNENCKWDMEVTCEDICEDINQKCLGPFAKIDARLVDVLEGCLYAHYSKVYSVTGTKNMKVQVRVTHFGDDGCEENNDLIIYDTCLEEIAHIENEIVETWIGKNVNNDIKVEIHSDSDNKNCLWKLEIDYLDEDCRDRCTAADGSNCSPYRCVEGGICSLTRCDKTTCGAECEDHDDCEEGEFCSSSCECMEGIVRTIKLESGYNFIGVGNEITQAEIETEGCILGWWERGNKLWDHYDEDEKLFTIVQGVQTLKRKTTTNMQPWIGYLIYEESDNGCEFDVIEEPIGELVLAPGYNLVSVPIEVTQEEIESTGCILGWWERGNKLWDHYDEDEKLFTIVQGVSTLKRLTTTVMEPYKAYLIFNEGTEDCVIEL
jgi:hypothetical protein